MEARPRKDHKGYIESNPGYNPFDFSPASMKFTTCSSLALVLGLCVALAGCSSPYVTDPTATTLPPTLTPAPTIPPTATATPAPTATATPLGCLTQPGRVDGGSLDETNPPQEFLIYLPPCYDQLTNLRYPVLYLLHGQTYTDAQWVDMGVPPVADTLIHSGQAAPFIIVFPDDRYWNLPPGPAFGDRLVNLIVPFIDANYRTLPDAGHRAVGGLSRGGGWAVHLFLTEYKMFGIVGLHSPVVFDADSASLEQSMAAIPAGSWPRLWVDAGDRDGQLGDIRRFESLLSAYGVPHIWHLYTGDHSVDYWDAHLTEYLTWYTQQFAAAASPAPSLTPTP